MLKLAQRLKINVDANGYEQTKYVSSKPGNSITKINFLKFLASANFEGKERNLYSKMKGEGKERNLYSKIKREVKGK